jgi:O-6-methylguanine DNA methyltransferase
METFRLSLEKSGKMSFSCLVDQQDQLVASAFGSNSRIVARHLIEYSTNIVGMPPGRGDHWLTYEMIKRFEGAKHRQSVRLNRDFVSTHQGKVCGVLEKIPPGKVTTYGLISHHIGSGARAVGGAVGSNPWSIFVPCHRVIPSNLSIGNYSLCGTLGEDGSVTKRDLLMREAVPVDENRIDSTAVWDPSEAD